ncbi:SUN family protein UTH1 [Aspergillus ruber CBS 135680]|uniref:SUN-domain-containing protein n=1 Tax=Aspergillus ruber (strain CBS 135680) TaxID=1388766 RepID=A0A017SQX6_ASPRC|nr:SUN-domain-containing protein [Aspergillus ruber CBS 135680]EYE98665.1 SUN-domain-containing protein [Aspergillus ruber CBS 135680]
MKLNSIALTLATAGLVAAQPHAHGHRHPQRRTVDTSGTVVKYELNGEHISAEKVCKGIADGTLLWAAGVAPPDACQSSSSSTTPSSTPTPTPTPTPSVAPAEFIQTSSSSTPTPSSSSTQAAASTPAASSSSSSSSATGIDVDFPDGEIDCSAFPSEYGAVKLDYHGLGGWTGIQYGSIVGDVIQKISTAISGEGECSEDILGNPGFCSYACPAGYQKSQWPKQQGSTGESVGGLKCHKGKLYLTNPSLSKKLCIEGVGGVYVQNKVGEQVAVCRTDYPGTEAETIPLALTDDTVQPLTCPNGATYYEWTGKSTSAQYYVNPKGTSIEEGCKWGDKSKPVGNFAPMNMGTSENDGKWLSLFQNSPTTDAKLDFCAEIKGDNLSGSCRYEKGSYISESGTNDSGCTVEVLSGDATVVFTAC